MEWAGGRNYERQEETFRSDGYVHYLDMVMVSLEVHLCQNTSYCTL